MTENNLISLIVPVYNAERFLRECLDSIINQSWKNIEIIIIEDCSTDGSLRICEEYAQKDARIVLFANQKNAGISRNRAKGISLSHGEYIAFVDADDYLMPDALENLHKGFSFGDNVLISNGMSYRLLKNGQLKIMKKSQWFRKETTIKSLGDFCADAIAEKESHYLWGKLFRHELFNYVKFKVLRHDEDTLFTYEVGNEFKNKTWNVVDINQLVYCYRENPDSLCNSSEMPHTPERLSNLDTIISHAKDNWPELVPTLEKLRLTSLTVFLTRCTHNRQWKEQYWKEYRAQFDDIKLYKGIKTLRGKQRNRFLRLKLFTRH